MASATTLAIHLYLLLFLKTLDNYFKRVYHSSTVQCNMRRYLQTRGGGWIAWKACRSIWECSNSQEVQWSIFSVRCCMVEEGC